MGKKSLHDFIDTHPDYKELLSLLSLDKQMLLLGIVCEAIKYGCQMGQEVAKEVYK